MQTSTGLQQTIGPKIHGASFNSDASCFSVAYSHGFRVFNSDPMVQWISREYDSGSLGRATMLDRTNCMALVGGGENPKYPETRVVIWDDHLERVALTLEFALPVLNVILSKTKMVVVLHNMVHIYSFPKNPKRLSSYETAANPHGLCAISSNNIVFPGPPEGCIMFVDAEMKPHLINGHKAPLRALELNRDYIVSASTTGTLIRAFSTTTKTLTHEFRRGLDKATIYGLSLNPQNQLACLSDKQTLHVFDIGNISENREHSLRNAPLAPRYFKSHWSAVSCQLPLDGRGILGWAHDDSVVVVYLEHARWEKYVILREEQHIELLREAWRRIDLDE